MRSFKAANIWQPLQMPSAKLSARSKKVLKSSRTFSWKRNRLRPPLACSQHIAIGKASTGDETFELA